MKEKVKMEIAKFLDRFEFTCWVNLVTWATGFTKFSDHGGNFCKKESETHCNKSCYCGKFYLGRRATSEDYKEENDLIDRAPF